MKVAIASDVKIAVAFEVTIAIAFVVKIAIASKVKIAMIVFDARIATAFVKREKKATKASRGMPELPDLRLLLHRHVQVQVQDEQGDTHTASKQVPKSLHLAESSLDPSIVLGPLDHQMENSHSK